MRASQIPLVNVDNWGANTVYRRWIVFLWAVMAGWGTTVSALAGSSDDARPVRPLDQAETVRTGDQNEELVETAATENDTSSSDGEQLVYEVAELLHGYSDEGFCDSCESGYGCDSQSTCCLNQGGWFAGGWIAQGFSGNPDDPQNNFNGPLTFNDRANEYQLNQVYVSLGRHADKDACRWGLGGRVDLLYGTDYFFTTSLGLETHVDGSPRWNAEDGPRAGGATLYGLSMPQLYAEAFAPIGSGITLKAGHFYSLLGHESVMATENFFYSRSYARQYGVPFTHTGVLAGYSVSPCLQVQGGVTRGWDNWEDNNSDVSFLGQFRWCSADGIRTVRFTLHTGKEDDFGLNARTTYSLIASRRISSRLSYVIEHVLGTEENGSLRNDTLVDADWFGVTNYLTYELSYCTQIGLRFEWFHDDDNARVLAIPLDGALGGDYHALTLGARHRLQALPCWEIRPELRYDWSNAAFPSLNVHGMYDDFTNDDQFTLAVSAIARF